MKVIGIAVAMLLLAAGGVIGFAYSGIFEVAATTIDAPAVRWVLETTRENSVRKGADKVLLPDLSEEDRMPRGAKAFDEMCASCHGAPGRAPFLGASDMNPPPPDLAEVARDRTPQALFWVIKNGLRMTGMPAWGPTHSDDQLWDLVVLMTRLPDLTRDEYLALAEGSGSDGHDHEHGTAVHAGVGATAVDVPVADDAAAGEHSHDAATDHAH